MSCPFHSPWFSHANNSGQEYKSCSYSLCNLLQSPAVSYPQGPAPYSLTPLGCVHTNRFESSPVQSSQTHKDAAVTLWLTFNGHRGSVYTPAESSRVQSHESCQVKSLDAACSIFVSKTLVIGRDGCCLEEEMDVEKLILLVEDHEAVFDASRCEHRNWDYIASLWQKIAQEMGVGKTSASMFYFLLWWWRYP